MCLISILSYYSQEAKHQQELTPLAQHNNVYTYTITLSFLQKMVRALLLLLLADGDRTRIRGGGQALVLAGSQIYLF